MAAALEPISLERFFWLEAFSGRLRELGAPASPEHLTELGGRLFERNPEVDARAMADAVWARWPIDNGLVPSD